MARRQLPPRSTRGQKPLVDQQQQEKDDKFYQKMFGQDLGDQDQDYQAIKRQEREATRKENMMNNLKKYSYAKGYHYFCNLNIFPRVIGHPSYAIDAQNYFNSTYSHQDKLYLLTPLKQLINRQYFGLPITQGERRRADKSKNICHSHLFETEDKKYGLDKYLYLCKKILNRFDSLVLSSKIESFKTLKRDSQLTIIFEPQYSLEQKKEALVRKISILEERKYQLRNGWKKQDMIYFYHSLNQQLHNRIQKLKGSFQFENIVQILLNSSCEYKQISESDQQEHLIGQYISSVFKYFGTDRSCISSTKLNNLIDFFKKKTFSLNSSSAPRFIFPNVILNFGTHHYSQAVKNFLNAKVSRSQSTHILAKLFYKKIFNSDFANRKVLSLSFEQSQVAWSQQKDKIQKYFRQNKIEDNSYINFYQIDELVSPNLDSNDQQIHILNIKNFIEITCKQYLLIILYYWIQTNFQPIYNYSLKNDTILSILESVYAYKYQTSLIEATNSQKVAVINYLVELFLQTLQQQNPFPSMAFKLYLNYDPVKNLAIIWRSNGEQRNDEDWETQKEQEDEEDEEEKQDKQDKQQEKQPEISSKQIKVSQNDDNEEGKPRKLRKIE